MKSKRIPLQPWREYYLYAKGHYGKTSDRMDDIIRLHAYLTGIEEREVSIGMIANVLLSVVHKHLNTPELFREFIRLLDEDNVWQVGYPSNKSYSKTWAIIFVCLSFLQTAAVFDNDGKEILRLGKADNKIINVILGNLSNRHLKSIKKA